MNRIYFKYVSIMIAALSLCAARVCADDKPASAPAESVEEETRRRQEELDSAKALLKRHGVMPNNYKMILKTSQTGHSFKYKGVDESDESYYYTDPGLLWEAKLSFRRRESISPYVGVALGYGIAGGAYLGGSVGFEKAFIYNGGFSITPSFGAHAGIRDDEIPLVGIHSIVEFAFSHTRIAPYLLAGLKISLYDGLVLPSLPLGAGLSFKI